MPDTTAGAQFKYAEMMRNWDVAVQAKPHVDAIIETCRENAIIPGHDAADLHVSPHSGVLLPHIVYVNSYGPPSEMKFLGFHVVLDGKLSGEDWYLAKNT